MNWTEIHADWKKCSPMLATWWPNLDDHDLRRIAGSRERLAEVLGVRLGIARDEVERQICAFEKEARLPGAVK